MAKLAGPDFALHDRAMAQLSKYEQRFILSPRRFKDGVTLPSLTWTAGASRDAGGSIITNISPVPAGLRLACSWGKHRHGRVVAVQLVRGQNLAAQHLSVFHQEIIEQSAKDRCGRSPIALHGLGSRVSVTVVRSRTQTNKWREAIAQPAQHVIMA
jgi:hypothetical protein